MAKSLLRRFGLCNPYATGWGRDHCILEAILFLLLSLIRVSESQGMRDGIKIVVHTFCNVSCVTSVIPSALRMLTWLTLRTTSKVGIIIIFVLNEEIES